MTDLEITKACAEAMGYKLDDTPQHHVRAYIGMAVQDYWPLTDDAQAMALVKKFAKAIVRRKEGDWSINLNGARNADLNRAICECVAKIKE